jgi:hypothetical protein
MTLDIDGNNNVNNNKRDGIATFDLCNQNNNQNLLPTTTELFTISITIEIKVMMLAEINEITNISNYRNIGYPNTQNIWVRR